MVLRQLGRENARNFVQPQVCNKANCLPYPFALIIAIRITRKRKTRLSPTPASLLAKSIYIHSFPLKFDNLAAPVFRFVVFSGALEFEEKGQRRV